MWAAGIKKGPFLQKRKGLIVRKGCLLLDRNIDFTVPVPNRRDDFEKTAFVPAPVFSGMTSCARLKQPD